MASRSVNKVILIGHLGQDAETRFTPSGVPVTSFSVATSRRWKDQQTNDWKEETNWSNVVVWQAESLATYLTKGKQVYVEGRLQTRSYDDKDNKKVYRTEVVAFASDVILLGSGAGRVEEEGGGGPRRRRVGLWRRKPQRWQWRCLGRSEGRRCQARRGGRRRPLQQHEYYRRRRALLKGCRSLAVADALASIHAEGGQPIARLTLPANSQTRASLSCLRRPEGSTRLCLRTTVMSSARAAESDWRPVSPACRKTCVGAPLWMLVVRGTTKTVSARS